VRALFDEGDVPPEAKGQGSLQVVLAAGAEKERVRTVELVLDASNSMWGQVEGRSKIEIAREALRSVVEGLPEGVHLGLRIYGHRWPRTDARACADSELVIPIGPLDRAALLRQVQGVTPRGRTPLVYSLQQTPNDFQGLPRGTVILVSDGIESCDGRLEDIVQAVRRHGLDLTVHIVGFDIREHGARAELERLANALGGRYFDATSAGQLTESLERTLRLEYEVLDAKGAVVARGLAGGDAVTLDSGEHTLRVLLEPTPVEARIRVAPGARKALTLSHRGGRWHLDGR
jgi:hypothetical protein